MGYLHLIVHERQNSCTIKAMLTITIHHIRQKGEQIFNEGFVADDEYGLSTLKLLSEDDSNLLVFGDTSGNTGVCLSKHIRPG